MPDSTVWIDSAVDSLTTNTDSLSLYWLTNLTMGDSHTIIILLLLLTIFVGEGGKKGSAYLTDGNLALVGSNRKLQMKFWFSLWPMQVDQF